MDTQTLQLAGTLAVQLAIIAGDEALGYRGAAITQALTALGTILIKGEEARAELEALAARVEQMVAEGREPTKEEWNTLRSESQRFHEILNPAPPPSDPVPPPPGK